MIGFDRPLRPEWIYESLLIAKPGQKLGELNKPFEGIARELTGKEGKRKVRTVLFRCFIRDEENKTKVRVSNKLKELSEIHDVKFMAPIYLFYLIGKTETLIQISEHLFRLYSFGSQLNLSFLKKKMVDRLGERDVVTRATGAFISTLECFDIIKEREGKLYLDGKLPLNEEQVSIILKLFSSEILKAPQISLNHLPDALFNYFEMPDIKQIAQRYNGEYWDYQHRMGDDLLIMR